MVLRSGRKACRLARRLLPLLPIALFAGGLALLQWIAGMPVTWLWLKTILVFAVTVVVVRALPWDRWLFRARHGSRLYHAALFALFVRHFAAVLVQESRRALTAHALAAPARYRAGWFRSLAHATGGLLTRAIVRAERFHAAQSLGGIAE